MMPDNFVLDPDVLDGYPSFGRNFTDKDSESKSLMSTTYPETDYYPSFGRPFIEFNLDCPFLMKIRPDVLDGYPGFKDITMFGLDCPFLMKIRPDVLDGYPGFKDIQWFKPPYPALMMTMEPDRYDGMPSYRKISDNYAAFKNATTLEQVIIPKSVKHIIDYAFYNTKIKSVTISRDCEYGEHSFPVDCVVNYY